MRKIGVGAEEEVDVVEVDQHVAQRAEVLHPLALPPASALAFHLT